VRSLHVMGVHLTSDCGATARTLLARARIAVRQFGYAGWLAAFLTCLRRRSHTESMAHIYLLFEFAKDEEKAQQARHKLETWKQAFRLDKKLLYKLERTAVASVDGEAKPAKAEKAKGKGKGAAKTDGETATPAPNEDIRLLVRLGFSGHEKLSEERWVQRIPSEEPFREASPVVVKPGEERFEATEKQFEDLD
jgi:hypothetical protein